MCNKSPDGLAHFRDLLIGLGVCAGLWVLAVAAVWGLSLAIAGAQS